jgi:hypothetical protein
MAQTKVSIPSRDKYLKNRNRILGGRMKNRAWQPVHPRAIQASGSALLQNIGLRQTNDIDGQ